MNKYKLIIDFIKRRFFTPETFCGFGSYLQNTHNTSDFIRRIIKDKKIKSIIDIGCGDMNWMKYTLMDSPGIISYTGIDQDSDMLLIASLAEINIPIELIKEDIRLLDKIHRYNLILCRDLLLHLENDEIEKVLKMFINSGSRWLITNNYAVLENKELNRVYEYTKRKRQSRNINLNVYPFNFPPPDKQIKEFECEHNRYLCLWDLDKIRRGND